MSERVASLHELVGVLSACSPSTVVEKEGAAWLNPERSQSSLLRESNKQQLRSQTAKKVLTAFVAHIHKSSCSREREVRIFSSPGLMVALLSVGDTYFCYKDNLL